MKKKVVTDACSFTGASNIKKYYSSFASASAAATTVCHGVHKHSEAPVPTLWELESWSIGALCQTEFFLAPLTLWTVLET
jgi:hypothetical protein